MVKRDFHYPILGSFFLLLAISWMANTAFAAERLSSIVQDDGAIEFQIHEPEVGEYTLKIKDIKDEKVVSSITSFKQGLHIPVMVSRLGPGLNQGVYRCELSRDGKIVNDGPSLDPAWSGDFETGSGTLDRRDSLVIWSASQPSLNRVLIMSKSGAILHTLKDWHFSGSGKQLSKWDFLDTQKTWNFSTYPALQVMVQSMNLPQGWLIVGHADWQQYKQMPTFATILSKIPDSNLDFQLKLDAPTRPFKQGGVTKSVFQVKEGTLLKTTLEDTTRKALDGQRYEILLYLDGEFFHEESQGIDPYTYKFPAFPLSMSPTFLTVNVIDYRGNLATQTVAVATKETP